MVMAEACCSPHRAAAPGRQRPCHRALTGHVVLNMRCARPLAWHQGRRGQRSICTMIIVGNSPHRRCCPLWWRPPPAVAKSASMETVAEPVTEIWRSSPPPIAEQAQGQRQNQGQNLAARISSFHLICSFSRRRSSQGLPRQSESAPARRRTGNTRRQPPFLQELPRQQHAACDALPQVFLPVVSAVSGRSSR